MNLKIFDVEHGACALLTCDNGKRILIDAGHNSTSGWKPGSYLNSAGITEIEMLVITNYDEDHVSGIGDLFDKVAVRSLWRNRSVSGPDIKKLKTEDGMGRGIERLVNSIENKFTGTGPYNPDFAGLERSAFHHAYPSFDDENNLSFVTFLKCHGVGVMFPGDMEKAGWDALLKRADFRKALSQTSVFVASHHGRESGCSEAVMDLCKPFYVVISDKGYMYDTQQTIPFYRKHAKGGPFREKQRRVLTTRRDGCIQFNFRVDGWGPF